MVIGNATGMLIFKHVGDKNTPLTKLVWHLARQGRQRFFVDCAACAVGLLCKQHSKGDTVMLSARLKAVNMRARPTKTLNAEWVDVKGQTVQKPQEQYGRRHRHMYLTGCNHYHGRRRSPF